MLRLNDISKLRFKKPRKGRLKRFKYNKNLVFGNIGLKAIESGNISYKQLESARQSINRKIKRKGKLWIRVSINNSITKKPLEARMGKGKGSIDHRTSKVTSGSIIFELCGIDYNLALPALNTGKAKLPLKTIIIL